MLDRDAGLYRAVATSVRAVVSNPGPMAAWGLIVASGLVIGSIPLLLGLIVVIFVIAFVYARVEGPVEVEPLAEKAGELLAEEDQRLDAVDGKVTK